MPYQKTDERAVLKNPKVFEALETSNCHSFRRNLRRVPHEKGGSGGLVERLFVSSKVVLDGSKAVRGGIPVVFPCFGPPERRYRNTDIPCVEPLCLGVIGFPGAAAYLRLYP